MIPRPQSPEHLESLLSSTSARIGVWRAGSRPLTSTWLRFRQDHAMARDAVNSELSSTFLAQAEASGYPVITTLATSRKDFILFPPKGKKAGPEVLSQLKEKCALGKTVQIVISDGLSAQAVEKNIPDLLPMLIRGLEQEKISLGTPIVVRYGRVAIADQLTHALGCKIAINLIGERPGLSSAYGLSAYITYNAGPDTISSDRTVVSNIHPAGTPAVEAGAYIVQLVKKILEHKVSGVRLQQLM